MERLGGRLTRRRGQRPGAAATGRQSEPERGYVRSVQLCVELAVSNTLQ